MAIPEGTRLGVYEIIAPVGSGGMGEVYRARDVQLGRKVAIKVLAGKAAAHQEALARFENEARLASSLNHPNIITIYAIGREGDRPYIAMEFVDGPTLQTLMESGPMSVDSALQIAVQIADGLAKAHEAGIVHRDLKPKNVMLTKDGLAKILDFGLSKLARQDVDPEATTVVFTEDSGITEPGIIMGTVDYMSPEQAGGRRLDFRSDQFSFASLLYALLTGIKPFHEDTTVLTLAHIIERDARPAREVNPRVPPALDAVLARCLMKDPRQRYASTADLVEALRKIQLGLQPRRLHLSRREWIRAAVAAVGAIAVAGGLWFLTHRPYEPPASALDWYRKGEAALNSMTFEAARKAFEQSVAADPKFALAHASLARAYDELDYSERAKESMLHAMLAAQETRLSSADQKRLRALQFIVSRDYVRATELLRELEEEASDSEKPKAALQAGWVAQQRDDTEAAAAAYERALKSDPRYAAAQLRHGFILMRRGQNDQALQNFTTAEELYNAASDLEGVTETLYQRANLLNRRSRPAEAIPVIDRALSVARATGNKYQEVRLELLESASARSLGDTSRAQDLAQGAINTAVAEKMDNLASSGLVTLGNSLLTQGDLEGPEAVFRRALDIAQRGKVRRYEALASTSLGSLFEQRSRPEEARQFIEAALPFYRQAGLRREFVRTMTVLGGLLEELGEFDESMRVLREALPLATELQDSQIEVQIRERLVETLQDKGAWPEALDECERTAASLGAGPQSNYARLDCAGLYWRLGSREKLKATVSEIEQSFAKNDKLLPLFKLRLAEMAYAEGRLDEARVHAAAAIAAAPAAGDSIKRGARLIQSLALIRTSRTADAAQAATAVIQEFDHANLKGNAAAARLLTAEALAARSDRSAAARMAIEALGFFQTRQVWESVWRAHGVVARYSPDAKEAEAHREFARTALEELKKSWPANGVELYLRRPEITALYTGLRF